MFSMPRQRFVSVQPCRAAGVTVEMMNDEKLLLLVSVSYCNVKMAYTSAQTAGAAASTLISLSTTGFIGLRPAENTSDWSLARFQQQQIGPLTSTNIDDLHV